jgi:hypothetical protein
MAAPQATLCDQQKYSRNDQHGKRRSEHAANHEGGDTLHDLSAGATAQKNRKETAEDHRHGHVLRGGHAARRLHGSSHGGLTHWRKESR